MTREKRLAYCKICKNRELNIERGMLCELTHEYASFDGSCPNFTSDDAAIKKQLERVEQEKKENGGLEESDKMRGASWFAWIGGLSLINSFAILIGFRLIFGLGVTTLFDLGAMAYNFQWFAITVSAIYTGYFIWTYYLSAKKEVEISYVMGYLIYLLDTILLIVLSFKLGSWDFIIDIVFHIGLLGTLYARHPFLSNSIFDRMRETKFSILNLVYLIIGSILSMVIFGLMFS